MKKELIDQVQKKRIGLNIELIIEREVELEKEDYKNSDMEDRCDRVIRYVKECVILASGKNLECLEQVDNFKENLNKKGKKSHKRNPVE